MVGLGNVENTALSTWAGTANITTVGTITSGTWNGTAIGNVYITQSSVTQHQAALTITTSQVSNLSITTNSVSDGTNTFTGKSYTIVTESLAVNESGEITLTSAAVANTLLNFNTARHTSGGVSSDYTVTHSAGNVYTVDASLNGQAVTVQYMKLV
jgi:fructose-specific component phosphotransferase system IIB-like protein